MFNNKVYDILKWVAIIFLPALAKLVEGVFAVWNLPYGSQIASTIIYVQVFLGACMLIDNIQYKKKLSEGEKDEPEDT